MANPNLYYDVVRKPHVTEKSTVLQDIRNQYTFEVAPGANKSEIRKAVETLFGVTVEKVCVLNVPSKARRMLGRPGHVPSWRKAIVRLKAGDSIDIV